MIYRQYGNTGIEVSAIGFGAMRFEDFSDLERNAALVKLAYDRGINYFDSAPGYGEGQSEQALGLALREMARTREERPFWVSTKCHKSDPAEVRADLEASLERLGLDSIDFYHVWWVMSLEAYRERKRQGAIREFEHLRHEGLVKHVCVSTHMTGEDIGTMLDDHPFDGLLLGYSVMNFAYRQAGLDAASRHELGVAVMNPLGGGIIPRHPKRFDFVRTRDDETVVEGALRFLLNDPRITMALVGIAREEHLDEAIRAADGFRPIPKETVERIRDTLSSSFDQLCTSCGYCDHCEEQIPVPRLMDVYNHHALADRTEMGNRIRWHWSIDPETELGPLLDRCSDCGECEEACTQKLPIRERFEVIREEAAKFVEEQKAQEES